MLFQKIDTTSHETIIIPNEEYIFCTKKIVSWADEMDWEEDKQLNDNNNNNIFDQKEDDDEKNNKEEELTKIIVEYMKDKHINPFEGSVPVERIQNIVRSLHPETYNIVVQQKYHGKWRHYVEANANVFVLLQDINDKQKIRIRLHSNDNWETGDIKEKQNQKNIEDHIIKHLYKFIEKNGNNVCQMDEFYQYYYSTIKKNQDNFIFRKLPLRGDIVRFIKKHNHLFQYDNKKWIITSKN